MDSPRSCGGNDREISTTIVKIKKSISDITYKQSEEYNYEKIILFALIYDTFPIRLSIRICYCFQAYKSREYTL